MPMLRKLSKIYTPYNGLLLIITLAICIFQAYTEVVAQSNNTITSSATAHIKIIDGDSLEIGSNRIRLIGIDAPEYNQYCKRNNQKYDCGKESIKFLKKLISTNNITCNIHNKDKYDRFLCTCYINNIDINAELVKNGHALSYIDSPYKKEEKEAKANKLGLWSGKFMHPHLFRRLKESQKN